MINLVKFDCKYFSLAIKYYDLMDFTIMFESFLNAVTNRNILLFQVFLNNQHRKLTTNRIHEDL